MYLSIIIPAYNEENRIGKTLQQINDYLKNQSYDYEIIVVNDGSKDRTSKVVLSLAEQIPNLRLIDNKKNNGKGFVVRQGMQEAKAEYRLFTDADNSTPISEIEKFIPLFGKHDIIIGSRAIKGADIKNPQPLFRRIIGKIFNLMVQILTRLWGIWDTQCGFKCLSKKSAEQILPLCKIDRFAFDPEILIIAKKLGYEIKQVPIVWINDLSPQ